MKIEEILETLKDGFCSSLTLEELTNYINDLQNYVKELETINHQLTLMVITYKNMRENLLNLIIHKYPVLSQSESDFKDDLLNILNKVEDSNE